MQVDCISSCSQIWLYDQGCQSIKTIAIVFLGSDAFLTTIIGYYTQFANSQNLRLPEVKMEIMHNKLDLCNPQAKAI